MLLEQNPYPGKAAALKYLDHLRRNLPPETALILEVKRASASLTPQSDSV